MHLKIDTSVTFELAPGKAGGSRDVTVDALELEDFIRNLWDTKGKDKEGETGIVNLDWAVIHAELPAWFEAQTGVKLRKSEVIAIWKECTSVGPQLDKNGQPVLDKAGQPVMVSQSPWAKKNAIWDAPAAATPAQPISPPSTDLACLE